MGDKIYYCVGCGKTHPKGDFYVSYNPTHKNGRLYLCKAFIKSKVYVGDDKTVDIKKFQSILRQFDIPFLSETYEIALNLGGDVIGSYFRMFNSLPQNRGLTWEDSEFNDINTDKVEEQINDSIFEEYTDEDYKAFAMFWGQGLDNWEYEFLENELFKLKTDFECSDYGMEMIMKDIAFTNLDVYKARMNGGGDNKNIVKLIETRSKLMTDGNLKPIQATGADKNEKLSLGVFIKKWENEKPIEEDIDSEMKRYIDTFMVGHLAKMQGLKNEFTDKYDKAIEDHTIDFEDLYSEVGDE